ncbi:hypothetical protein NPIL_547871 [Nephila pilipes]|uniref:Uncharacterized protein n=1 Tax=Nephila pilipes TaxID=299642 RepID=A0A8X6PQT7_NEPPI|nr:hypothetical protein NPIL_547871 [Nephila pilipes]
MRIEATDAAYFPKRQTVPPSIEKVEYYAWWKINICCIKKTFLFVGAAQKRAVCTSRTPPAPSSLPGLLPFVRRGVETSEPEKWGRVTLRQRSGSTEGQWRESQPMGAAWSLPPFSFRTEIIYFYFGNIVFNRVNVAQCRFTLKSSSKECSSHRKLPHHSAIGLKRLTYNIYHDSAGHSDGIETVNIWYRGSIWLSSKTLGESVYDI